MKTKAILEPLCADLKSIRYFKITPAVGSLTLHQHELSAAYTPYLIDDTTRKVDQSPLFDHLCKPARLVMPANMDSHSSEIGIVLYKLRMHSLSANTKSVQKTYI